jgi:hypothetical protein
MRTTGLFFAVVLSLSTFPMPAADSGITYADGDGSSEAKAVLIQNAASDSAATHAEYVYLAAHFPNCRFSEQALLNDGKKYYDRLDFIDAAGSNRSLYFDITASFEKLEKMLQNSHG